MLAGKTFLGQFQEKLVSLKDIDKPLSYDIVVRYLTYLTILKIGRVKVLKTMS